MSKTLTLEEAAQQLGLTAEQFKVNLKTHKDFKSVRPLMGGATMHFRTQDIDELGRRLGLGSEAEVQLGNAGSDPVIPLATDDDDEQIEIGRDAVRGTGASSARLSSKSSQSSKKLKSTPVAPPPRDDLVLESSDEFIPLVDSGSGRKRPDSSVRLKKSPDSGVRRSAGGTPGHNTPTDEVIDLEREASKSKSKSAKGEEVFELAPDAPAPKSSKSSRVSAKKPADNSEFELKIGADSDSEFELTIADDGSDEADIGVMPKDATSKGGKSGVRLSSPADSGISLEKDSDSEFELNLDSHTSSRTTGPKSSSRRKKIELDSDSEFELTLDDSSSEIPVPSKGKGEKDIFETDFDIPALDDESASEAVVLEDGDTDLESSDFDLALDESGVLEESASEVVELEEELEAEEETSKSKRRRKRAVMADDDDGPSASDALAGVDDDEDDEVERAPVSPSAPPKPAKWGPLPALVLMPCLVVMFFVALMGYEMIHGMWGFRQPTKATSPITRAFAGMFVNESEMPKE